MSPGMIEGYTRQDLLFRCVSCKKDVTDLRLLPCVHTVCLECLQRAGHGKVAGEEIACPQCEEGFKIPPDGLVGIQKNFVIQKLQYIEKLQPETSCEFCSNDSSIDQNKPPRNTQEIPPEISLAVVYCVECEHKICERCREAHKKVKTSRNHRFVDLGNKSEIEKLTRSIPQSYCDQHPTEVVRIFCKSCQLPVCHICFEDGHTSHKFSTIEKAGNSFRKKISCQLEDNLDYFGNFRVQISKIEHQMDEIRENGRQVEEEIKWRADALKEIITHHSELLINEAKSHIDKRLKTMKGLLDTIKMRESMLLHLDNYTKVMTPNVTDAEMCRAFSDINDRFNVLKEDPDEIPTMFNRLFLKQSLLEERWGIYENNIIGKIADICQVGGALVETAGELSGITYLEDLIYTIHRRSNIVRAFNGFPPFQRIASEDIVLPCHKVGKLDPRGICASAECRCMYVIDPEKRILTKIVFSGDESEPIVLCSWLLNCSPCGISMSMANDLLILGYESKQEDEIRTESEGDNRSSEGDNRSSDGDKRMSEGDNQSSEGDNRSSEGDKRMSEGDNQSSEGDDESTERDNRWSEGDKRLSEGDKESTEGDNRSSDGDNRSSEGDNQSSEGDKRMSEGDNRSAEGDNRSSEEDRRMSEGDNQSSEEDNRSSEEDRRMSEGDNQSSEGDNRSSEGDNRSSEEDNRLSEGDNLFSDGDDRPSRRDKRFWFLQLHTGSHFTVHNPVIPIPDSCPDPIQAIQTSRKTFFVLCRHGIAELSISGHFLRQVGKANFSLPIFINDEFPVVCFEIDEDDALFVDERQPTQVVQLDARQTGKSTRLKYERGGTILTGMCYVKSRQWLLVGSDQPASFSVYSLRTPTFV